MIGGDVDAQCREVIDASALDEVIVRVVSADGPRSRALRFGAELDAALAAGGADFFASAKAQLATLHVDGAPVVFEPLSHGRRWLLTIRDRAPFFVVQQRMTTRHRLPTASA